MVLLQKRLPQPNDGLLECTFSLFILLKFHTKYTCTCLMDHSQTHVF